MTADPDHVSERNRIIRIRTSAFNKYAEIMNGNLPVSLKRKLYNSCILPVLTYGAETKLAKKVELRLSTMLQAVKVKSVTL